MLKRLKVKKRNKNENVSLLDRNFMKTNELKRAIIFSNVEEIKEIRNRIGKDFAINRFSVPRIIECILNHSLFPDSMNSEIWEVIAKHI